MSGFITDISSYRKHRADQPPVIDIWHVPLERTEQELAACERLLAAAERTRAGQFSFALHRRRFVAARASLRSILARYLLVPPQNIRFDHGANGKPGLAVPGRHTGIEFNVSYADDRALIAVAHGCAVGIDIERIRAELATPELAQRVFSRRELADLSLLPTRRRCDAFFRGWTSKEAYVKGCGDGLSLPLQEFDVSVDPDRPAMLLQAYGCSPRHRGWSLHAVDVGPGYAATLAAARWPARIDCYAWRPHRPRSFTRVA